MNACRSHAFFPLFPEAEPRFPSRRSEPLKPSPIPAAKPPPLVTAVIGFTTKEGIVVATDSQVTRGNVKRCDSRKLVEVRFKGGSALVARAGSVEGADIFHEIFDNLAASTEVTSARTMADCAELALKQARAKIIDAANHSGLPDDYGRTHFESLAHSVLLAYVFQGKPYIFQADSIGTNAIKNLHHFVTAGSGQDTAAFILEGMDTNSMSELSGIGLAAYTIEMCKRADLYCAGPTQIGYVDQFRTRILDREEMELTERAVTKTYRNVCDTLANHVAFNAGNDYPAYFASRKKVLSEQLAALDAEKAKLLSAVARFPNRKPRK
jgi:20S proteasome alpha/beta subunit